MAATWLRALIQRRLDRREPVHFLHIGKCAGSQILRVAEGLNAARARHRIVKHGHRTLLWHLPPDAAYFFSIRDPITRFRSGFYSRKRKGQPRIYSEWSPHDARAFADFEHANDLAEALFQDGPEGLRAFAAIKSITHASMNQVDWISTFGHFLDVRPPLAILRQERFEDDLRLLSAALGIDLAQFLARSGAAMHANDYSDVPDLSPRAVANLCRWYAQDFVFQDLCRDWIEARLTTL